MSPPGDAKTAQRGHGGVAQEQTGGDVTEAAQRARRRLDRRGRHREVPFEYQPRRAGGPSGRRRQPGAPAPRGADGAEAALVGQEPPDRPSHLQRDPPHPGDVSREVRRAVAPVRVGMGPDEHRLGHVSADQPGGPSGSRALLPQAAPLFAAERLRTGRVGAGEHHRRWAAVERLCYRARCH